MKRREFLKAAAGIVSTFAFRSSPAQELQHRAAVVIGINKTGGHIPELNDARPAALRFAVWLRTEGFEVHSFTDDRANAVRMGPIKERVAELVSRPTLQQLIIYFSGHGLYKEEEIWLLSGAPEDPDEAISLLQSSDLAKEFPIPNIVFIADTCRTIPTNRQQMRVHGKSIFPNIPGSGGLRPKIDKFYAAPPGEPALELPTLEASRSFTSVFTDCLLDAYQHPDASMVHEVHGQRVIPNNRLQNYVVREMRKRVPIKYQHDPEFDVVPDDANYIGRVAPQMTQMPAPPRINPATMHEIALAEIEGPLTVAYEGDLPLGSDVDPLSHLDVRAEDRTRFKTATAKILKFEREQPDIRMGFAVLGASVKSVIANPQTSLKIYSPTHKGTTIEVETGSEAAASVAIQFDDGSGTIVAALKDYVGMIIVEQGRVINVSYLPSRDGLLSPMFPKEWSKPSAPEIQQLMPQIVVHSQDRLRAATAVAARFGVWRTWRSGQTVNKGAPDKISSAFGTGLDPTLSLYESYGFAAENFDDIVLNIGAGLKRNLKVNLYDVAMLSGKSTDDRLVPFCPMLARGWALVNGRNVKLLPDVQRVRDYIRPALWTTFEAEGMDIIVDALQAGRLG